MVNLNLENEGDAEMRSILEGMLASDQDITARAVARLHPSINAASSITRNESRKQLLAHFQKRQVEYRHWRGRVGKQSGVDTAADLEKMKGRITELEQNNQALIASHVAMLRAVGEVGGFQKWAQFYVNFRTARERLDVLGALSETEATHDKAET